MSELQVIDSELNESKPNYPEIDYGLKLKIINAEIEKFLYLKVKTKEGYSETKKGIAIFKGWRVKVEKRRKLFRKNALEFIDNEARVIQELINPIEEKLKADKKVVDDENDRIKAEKAEIEAKRIDDIKNKINLIRSLSENIYSLCLNDLECNLNILDEIKIEDNEYREFEHEANGSLLSSKAAVAQAIEARRKFDEEAERQEKQKKWLADKQLKAEQEAKEEAEQLAKVRADLEAKKVETQKIIDDENERLAKKKADDDKSAKEAEEKLIAERKKFEDEKAEFEASKKPAEVIEPKPEPGAEVETKVVSQEISKADIVDASTPETLRDLNMVEFKSQTFDDNKIPPAIKIVQCVAKSFGVNEDEALYWLLEFDSDEINVDFNHE